MTMSPSKVFETLCKMEAGYFLGESSVITTGEKIKTPDERREEWLKQRLGKFTASDFHRLMGYEDKPELPKGAQTYAKQKAAECLTECVVDTYISPSMQWGMDHEAEAIDAFMMATGLNVHTCKDGQQFIRLGNDIGGTPDGLIGLDGSQGGIEVKCPSSTVHLDYMEITDRTTLKQVAPDYYWQIIGLMMITGSDSWWFVSYDPRFKNESMRLHTALIFRHEPDILKLRNRLSMAIEYRDAIIYQIRNQFPVGEWLTDQPESSEFDNGFGFVEAIN